MFVILQQVLCKDVVCHTDVEIHSRILLLVICQQVCVVLLLFSFVVDWGNWGVFLCFCAATAMPGGIMSSGCLSVYVSHSHEHISGTLLGNFI